MATVKILGGNYTYVLLRISQKQEDPSVFAQCDYELFYDKEVLSEEQAGKIAVDMLSYHLTVDSSKLWCSMSLIRVQEGYDHRCVMTKSCVFDIDKNRITFSNDFSSPDRSLPVLDNCPVFCRAMVANACSLDRKQDFFQLYWDINF